MSSARPFFRKFDGWWYVWVTTAPKRRQVKLVKGRENKAEAYRVYHQLLSQQDLATAVDRSRCNVASLCEAFLDWSAKHNRPEGYAWYRNFLQQFVDVCGTLEIAALKPFHVQNWIDDHKDWSQATVRSALTAVKRVCNWAVELGYLDASPLRALKRPSCPRRETVISLEQHQALLAATDDPFRDVLTALWETGARPGEVSAVTAAEVDFSRGIWVLSKHKTASKTGKRRVIVLTDTMIALTRRLMERYPEGTLFRNENGEAWNRNAIRLRMQRLRKKLSLPEGTVAYSYRHAFATRGLSRNVSVAKMAELLGHSDVTMLMEHYAHLENNVGELRDAAILSASTLSTM